MSRIQINLGLIGNVIMGARLRQHRLLDFVFVGNIISEPPLRAINAAIRASDRSTLSCGPSWRDSRCDFEAALFEYLSIITGRRGQAPSFRRAYTLPSAPAYAH